MRYVTSALSVSLHHSDFQLAVISITAHGGFINGFLTAIGRQRVCIPTGGESLQLSLARFAN